MLVILITTLVAAESEVLEYQDEFLKGMEAGFFIRNQKEGHRDYQCPDVNVDKNDAKTLNDILTPVKMIIALMKNDTLDGIWSIVLQYVDFIMFSDMLTAKTYKGSDFCGGLIFGSNGSRMLLEVARMVIDLASPSTS